MTSYITFASLREIFRFFWLGYAALGPCERGEWSHYESLIKHCGVEVVSMKPWDNLARN